MIALASHLTEEQFERHLDGIAPYSWWRDRAMLLLLASALWLSRVIVGRRYFNRFMADFHRELDRLPEVKG